MSNSNDMKKIVNRLILFSTIFFFTACDKDFVEINTNPYSITSVDPAVLLAGAQRSHLGNWSAEHTIVQQFVTPYNTGAHLGFNFNEDVDEISNPKWDNSYTGPLKN